MSFLTTLTKSRSIFRPLIFCTFITLCIVTLLPISFLFAAESRITTIDHEADYTELFKEYQQLIPEIMKNEGVPGLAIAVVNESKVLWAQGFGFTDSERKTPVTPETVFSMQGISKTFTATAIMMAVQDGILNLDTPIATYLPDFKINSTFDKEPMHKITLRHLLSDTAGFSTLEEKVDYTGTTLEKYIQNNSGIKLAYPIGEYHDGSDFGFDLAGYILQVISGKSFTQYANEKLLKPIGMTNSIFQGMKIGLERQALISRDSEPQKFLNETLATPARGLYSNTIEMAKYIQFELNQGRLDNQSLLGKSTFEIMNIIPFSQDQTEGKALGLKKDTAYDVNYYYYSDQGGFNNYVTWYPEYKIGLVILTNSTTCNLHISLPEQLLNRLISIKNKPQLISEPAPNPQVLNLNSKDVVAILQKTRSISYLPQEELKKKFKSFLYPYTDFINELSTNVITYSNEKSPPSINMDDAIKDVDFLFRLFKYGYCAYQYYGGDVAFATAKDKILAVLNKKGSSILVPDFNQILFENLNFIQDGHSRLGKYCLYQRKDNYYSSWEYYFYKDNTGFYTQINNVKYYLVTVNNENPISYLKLSLDFEGNIIYRLILISERSKELDLSLKSSDTIIEKKVTLKKPYEYPPSDWGYYEIDGIPVVECRTLFPDTKESTAEYDYFLKKTISLRHRKVFILDLRGNGGGYADYTTAWIENYLGETPVSTFNNCSLLTETARKLQINDTKKTELIALDNFLQYSEKEKKKHPDVSPEGWSAVNYSKVASAISNKNLIIVLTDSNMASAAEIFTDRLRQINNVIFIGENTGGRVMCGNNGICKLPHSKLYIRLGTSFMLRPDCTDIEGKGFYPDFWVDPSYALECALKFARNYSELNK